MGNKSGPHNPEKQVTFLMCTIPSVRSRISRVVQEAPVLVISSATCIEKEATPLASAAWLSLINILVLVLIMQNRTFSPYICYNKQYLRAYIKFDNYKVHFGQVIPLVDKKCFG